MGVSIEYVELNAKSNYSFLEGASHPEEMIGQAALLEYQGIALTDRHGVYGAPRAHAATKQTPIPLILGAEVTVGSYDCILLARNREGYGDLCELLTLVNQVRENKQATWEQLIANGKDLFLLLPVKELKEEVLPPLVDFFGDRLVLLASRQLHAGDKEMLEKAETLSRQFELDCVASNQPLFHLPERKCLQDTLTCIRHTCTLKEGGFRLLPNRERHLKSKAEMLALFSARPEWLSNTVKIAEQCRFSLEEIHYRYPIEWIPEGKTADGYLEELVWQGANVRYPTGVPAAVKAQLLHELKLIEELRYADYFLTIWDIVQYAERNKILCQGRGSAANSCVCYVLAITAIDPIRMELLFERFLSRERKEPPDIDIDFEHERREEVIQYIYERYGRHRAAITAEVICFRRKSAFREVAKVFEIALPSVEKVLTRTHREDLAEFTLEELHALAPEVPAKKFQLFFALVKRILSFPRHLGTHVGGFVLCHEPLNRNVPIEKAAMEGRTIIQWDKNDLDALGYVKVDILGLGILTCLRKAFELLETHYQLPMSMATIPSEDRAVYLSMCRGDTVGVFQIESRAQMNMLPRLKPMNFFDLVVEISIVRPGPIQGEMVHPYLRRRAGEEHVEYPHPDLEAILKKTFGVPLFQEQIMKMAMQVAGFSAGEADELRRMMGTWRRHGKNRLSAMGEKFKAGLMKKGIDGAFADRIFSQIEGFAEYGFPESHAASFALIAYATAYLRLYYPDVYLVAILNSQPMGFYSPQSLIYDGVRHGVKVLGIDANLSGQDNRLEKKLEARLGFRAIRGFAKRTGLAIEKAREVGPFESFDDFVTRVKAALVPNVLTKRELFLLAGANAFESLGLPRREALWEIQGLDLVDSPWFSPESVQTHLKEEGEWESITLDFEAQGVSLYAHPMEFLREDLQRRGAVVSEGLRFLPMKKRVKVAGIVICRQMPPTASGVLFVSLEDEKGFINLVVWRKVYEKYREVLITQSFLWCEGHIEKAEKGSVIHVIAEHVEPLLNPRVKVHKMPSHDFH